VILWLDLETTGIDPERDLILELAAIYEQGHIQQFGPMAVGYPETVILRQCNAYVRQMHTETGLIQRCSVSQVTLHSLEVDLMRHLALTTQPDPEGDRIILAGFSVHFDRNFVMAQMPTFAAHLSHRVLDVSSIRRFLEDHPHFGAMAKEYNDNHPRPHKAMDDCKAAIETYRFYRDMIHPELP